MITWTYSRDPVGGWYWHYPELLNGWSPCVSDLSQSSAPTQPTTYQVSAASSHMLLQSEKYASLEVAKREAILFAMGQRNAGEVYAEAIAQVRVKQA